MSKNLLTAAVCLANLAWWCVPSDVPRLVGEESAVLLGRYSEGRFWAMLLGLAVSSAAIFVLRAPPAGRRPRVFHAAAVGLGTLAGVLALDLGARALRSPRYVRTGDVYHREPGTRTIHVFRDLPSKDRPLPFTPAGHPDVEYVFTTDARGFRNRTSLDRYDVVALGDSFVEGDKVSDEQTWTAICSRSTGRSVYNLGMSGADPESYVRNLQAFGSDLAPAMVLCMIYEGNDFFDTEHEEGRFLETASRGARLRAWLGSSPVRLALRRFFSEHVTLPAWRSGGWREHGPPGRNGARTARGEDPAGSAERLAQREALSWLPVKVPPGESGHYYSLNARRVAAHYGDLAVAAQPPGVDAIARVVLELRDLCRKLGARLVVVYAPEKAHVVLPLVEDRVSADQIAAFLALQREDLPPAEEAKANLFAMLGAREAAVRAICEREGVDFVELTSRLREAVADGAQPYYTYDQHWSPAGHELVAEAIRSHLEPAPADRGP
jgi:hypothetical protein